MGALPNIAVQTPLWLLLLTTDRNAHYVAGLPLTDSAGRRPSLRNRGQSRQGSMRSTPVWAKSLVFLVAHRAP